MLLSSRKIGIDVNVLETFSVIVLQVLVLFAGLATVKVVQELEVTNMTPLCFRLVQIFFIIVDVDNRGAVNAVCFQLVLTPLVS